MTRSKIDIDTLMLLYDEHKTLDAVAAIVGLNRASIHERLQKAGYEPTYIKYYTDAERGIIREAYTNAVDAAFDLKTLATRLNRPAFSVCREARKMGLTDMKRPSTESVREKIIERAKLLWLEHPHPRGFLGGRHSDVMRQEMSIRVREEWEIAKATGTKWMSEENLQKYSDLMSERAAQRSASSSPYSRGKRGKRADLNDVYFRSSWEANYARYLNLMMREDLVEWWGYETKRFSFPTIKRGTRTYAPDFEVKYRDTYYSVFVEVKGWMDEASKRRLSFMAQYHPEITLNVVGAKEYKELKLRWSRFIEHWEF